MNKAIIIDDDASNLEVLTMIVQSKGWDVLSCLDGKDLITTALIYRPRLIILDIILADGDGMKLCTKLREEPLLKTIPIYLISTNKPSEGNISSAKASGFIEKPFEIEVILNILDQFEDA